MWSSSLTDSLEGKPDNSSVGFNTRIAGLSDILDSI